TARALVTVSAPLARKLERHGRPVWEVRNGCDPEDFAGLERPEGFATDRKHLDIVFTGNVYLGHYDVRSFCEGLALFLGQGGTATVHVAGRNTAALQQEARRTGLDRHFRFAATVPREQALAMQKHADVLLFFIWATGNEGIYSLKLFEYAGAGRPVLAVGPRGDVAGLVVDAGLGTVCTDAAEVASQLQALRDRKQEQGALAQTLRPGFDLTRRAQFAQLQRHLASLGEAR
ncbi:MAG TPA: glycosyltransferase, partial [Ramlibacter sp.]|nr:glycosyltransferase [Ramlibacter sp.]